MLQKQTVDPGTFSVLKTLMELPLLDQFCLVGGTALSLKYGHRKSIDLDLFCNNPFDQQAIIDSLQETFGNKFVYRGNSSKWGIFCFIDNIKVDIVYYPHPLIRRFETIEGIRLYHDYDLMAMKVQALLGRGVRKDFWDIAELLQNYSIDDLISCHKEKYPNQMLGISIPQALVYFADADESENPIAIKIKSWDEIRSVLKERVRNFLK